MDFLITLLLLLGLKWPEEANGKQGASYNVAKYKPTETVDKSTLNSSWYIVVTATAATDAATTAIISFIIKILIVFGLRF